MATTEEAETVMKTGMIDKTIDHGALEIITFRMIVDVTIEVPPKTQTESKSSASASLSNWVAFFFGGAKFVDTATRELEVEEWLKKEPEKLQC